MFRQVRSNERVKSKILNNKKKNKKRKGNLNGEQKGKAAKSPVAAGSSGNTHTHKGFPATERLRCDGGNMKQQTTRRICVYLLSINQKTERRVGRGL